jgi:membrane protein YqaA with SNARE-associated domain
MVSAVAIALGTLIFGIASGLVPVLSIEVVLAISATTTGHAPLLAAQVIVAAAGQMVGKSCYFVGGRHLLETHRLGRFGRVVAWAGRRRPAAVGTLVVSATTGLPPFGVVSALAGGWRFRLRSFYALGFAGRAARFSAVVAAPGLLGF